MSKFKHLDQTIKETKTKVIFRKFPDGEIIALFPELPGDMRVDHCLSYLHIGQHGCADISIYYDTKPCKDAANFKLNALYSELKMIGYNLIIVTRFSHLMNQKRIAALRASC